MDENQKTKRGERVMKRGEEKKKKLKKTVAQHFSSVIFSGLGKKKGLEKKEKERGWEGGLVIS